MAPATANPKANQRRATPSETIPRLEQGDRLTRSEFERRYHAMPNSKKAELIEGIVHMPSPVRITNHGEPHSNLITWMGHYSAYTAGLQTGDNATTRLDADNEPQPDALLRVLPEFGGQSSTSEDGYIEGAPELIAEITASTESYDLHDKKNVYRRNGVREYLVVLTRSEEIHWWSLEEGAYEEIVPEKGVLKSRVFPGLWLAPEALLAGEMKAVLEMLQEGIATAEHATFLAGLKKTD